MIPFMEVTKGINFIETEWYSRLQVVSRRGSVSGEGTDKTPCFHPSQRTSLYLLETVTQAKLDLWL